MGIGWVVVLFFFPLVELQVAISLGQVHSLPFVRLCIVPMYLQKGCNNRVKRKIMTDTNGKNFYLINVSFCRPFLTVSVVYVSKEAPTINFETTLPANNRFKVQLVSLFAC